jgi:hypothetical protein
VIRKSGDECGRWEESIGIQQKDIGRKKKRGWRVRERGKGVRSAKSTWLYHITLTFLFTTVFSTLIYYIHLSYLRDTYHDLQYLLGYGNVYLDIMSVLLHQITVHLYWYLSFACNSVDSPDEAYQKTYIRIYQDNKA